jgi:hypothetical protein
MGLQLFFGGIKMYFRSLVLVLVFVNLLEGFARVVYIMNTAPSGPGASGARYGHVSSHRGGRRVKRERGGGVRR